MIENTTVDLTIVVPLSVQTIDEAICDGHILTIAADPGSHAESFAREHNLKFLVARWYLLDLAESEVIP